MSSEGAALEALCLDADCLVQQTVGRAYITVRVVLDHDMGYRAFTTVPAHYPVGRGKPFAETPWRRHTLIEGRQFVAATPEAIVETYPDSTLVVALGARCLVNSPIFGRDGAVIGLLNVAAASTYDEAALRLLATVAVLLGPAVAAAQSRLQAERSEPAAEPDHLAHRPA